MQTSKRKFSMALACFAGAALISSSAARTITEFTDTENQELGWKVVDDGVMGGLSQGVVSFTKEGTLRFAGKLSLENNGGFSSLRTGDLDLDLSASDGLVARVKGDGRTYQMRLGSDARYRGMEVSFMSEFPTEKDKWIEVRVPFSDFVGSFRGRTLQDEVLNTAKIQRIGLLLADKKAGGFELEVDWLRTYSGKPVTVVDAALADGRFKTLATALTEAGLVDVLGGDGPFTVFAPTDEAFGKLPEETVKSLLKPENRARLTAILTYHVSPGRTGLAGALGAGAAPSLQGGPLTVAFADGQVRVNEAAVIDADIECSNGVIHVIDSVLLPPDPSEEPASKSIIGVAKSAGKFNTLLAAVDAAGLTSVLEGDGPFTVLAPTDEAFTKLPEGTVDSLLKEENLDQLKAILSYHVIAGKISAGDALNAKSAESLNGKPVEFSIRDGVFLANGSTIASVDIACENGVIHIIDSVLLPPTGNVETPKPAIEPAAMIEDAIDRGVPAFNHGKHAECAAIYKACLESLAADDRVELGIRKALKLVLEHAGEVDGDRDLAWLFRQGLDHAYRSVSN